MESRREVAEECIQHLSSVVKGMYTYYLHGQPDYFKSILLVWTSKSVFKAFQFWFSSWVPQSKFAFTIAN